MSFLLKGGTNRLSQLIIDVDKDWHNYGLSNLKELANGMLTGDLLIHNGIRLIKLSAGGQGLVLTSQGPGNVPVWAPGGTYLDRFFPCEIVLNQSAAKFIPDKASFIAAILNSPYGYCGVSAGGLNPGWFRSPAPVLSLNKTAGVFIPNAGKNLNMAQSTQYEMEIPVGGAVADDTVTLTDQTSQAKSGFTKYENYLSGEDSQKDIGSASAWEAQTFTPAASHAIRFIWLKLYGTGAGVTITVSIKAVDGSGHPSGPDLCSATLSELNLVSPGRYTRFTFPSPATLVAGTQYALIVKHGGGLTLSWRCDASSPAYAGGRREYSSNAGTSWTSDAAVDFLFEEWGTPTSDMTLLPAVLNINSAYYFGHAKKFSVLISDIGQAGMGTYSLAWEYSQGAGVWASCIDLLDGSNAFKNAWTQEISHSVQNDWATDTVSGIANQYWLRARCNGTGSGYGQPKGNFSRVRITV